MNKMHLTHIQYLQAATMAIVVSNANPDKPFRIYYCDRDTGRCYARIGNASRYLEKIARQWDQHNPGCKRTYSGMIR